MRKAFENIKINTYFKILQLFSKSKAIILKIITITYYKLAWWEKLKYLSKIFKIYILYIRNKRMIK